MKQSLRIVIITGTILLCAAYMASLFTPYINPAIFWPLTFLALGYPVIAVGMLVLCLGWLFFNRRIALLILLLFIAGYKNLASVFAFNIPSTFRVQKNAANLRIVSWNVRGFNNNAKRAESPDSARRKMINFLKEINADVLLLQENVEYKNASDYSNTQMLHDTLGYKYHYSSKDIIPETALYETGSAIFSRLPLTDTACIYYAGLSLPEGAVRGDVVFSGRKLRLITTHLVSMNLQKTSISRTDENYKKHDSAFIYGTSKFTKLKYYDSLHSRQAHELKNMANNSSSPVIVSGDFNAVPGSNTYHIVRGNLQDAFVEKAFGFGRTYSSLSPTLRIDYVFCDTALKVVQYSCPLLYLSDHFPVVTDVTWR